MSFIDSFEAGTSILTLNYITNLCVNRWVTSVYLSLTGVLLDRLSVAMEALFLFDMEDRGFGIMMMGGVLMTRGEEGVSTSIMVLDRGEVGDFLPDSLKEFFYFLHFSKADFVFVCLFFCRCLFLFLASNLSLSEYFLVLLASREHLLGFMLTVAVSG